MKTRIAVSGAAVLAAVIFGSLQWVAAAPAPGELSDAQAFRKTWRGGEFLTQTPPAVAASSLADAEKVAYLLGLVVVARAPRLNPAEFLAGLSAKEHALAMETVDLAAVAIKAKAQAAVDEAEKIKRPVEVE